MTLSEPTIVGLIVNEDKPAAVSAAANLTRFLAARGISVHACTSTVEKMAAPTGSCFASDDTQTLARADFLVVFGGDGTLLAAARTFAAHEIPLLGVHLGRFGFIAETSPAELNRAVETILAGDAHVDERLLLEATVVGEGARPQIGVNDVAVTSRAVRMVHVDVTVGGEYLATFDADGVLVASPTGSTSYSLSAGGPLVHPNAPVLLITPISPHTLNARTVIVPDTETIELKVNEGDPRDAPIATIDGQIETPLQPGNIVQVRRSAHRVRLLAVGGPSFYHKIRSRWHYGIRRAV